MDNIEAKLNQYQPQILSIFRIMFGLLILQHGCKKWFGIPVANPDREYPTDDHGRLGRADRADRRRSGHGRTVHRATRRSSFRAQMAVAYFYHAIALGPRGLTADRQRRQSRSRRLLFRHLLLVFFGAGIWSLDAMLRKRT